MALREKVKFKDLADFLLIQLFCVISFILKIIVLKRKGRKFDAHSSVRIQMNRGSRYLIITTFSLHLQSEKNTVDKLITCAQNFKSRITLQSIYS